MSINSVAISGNLTRDAELRMTAGGAPVLGFGVAVNDRRRNPKTGEWEDVPNYIDCILFGKYAESMQPYLVKGAKVAVSGRLRYSSWEKDGQRRSKLEVVADHVETLAQRQQPQTPAQQPRYSAPASAPAEEYVYDEDIPF